MYYKSASYRVVYAFIILVVAAASLLCVLPIIHVLAVSFSGKLATSANLVTFWPKDFTLDAYTETLKNEQFIRAFMISVLRVLAAVSLGMLVTVLTAYPLSKGSDVFKFRSVFTWYLLITMLFGGGLIPFYILIKEIHLYGSFWVLVIPGLVNVFNIVLMLNFFRGVPKEMEEAALMDGATQFQTLMRVYLPMSLPSIATLSLFLVVGNWNSWFDGMLFLRDSEQWPLATLLQQLIVQMDFTSLKLDIRSLPDINNRTLKAAQIFIGILPVLLVYPFMQRYFVQGLTLGAVKE